MWLERVAGTEWEERRMKLRLLGVWWFGGEGGERRSEERRVGKECSW